MKTTVSLALLGAAFIACAGGPSPADPAQAAPAHEVVPASEVRWEPLNPARGDRSPKAGTLWGDRKGSVPTGFLVRFVDGFSSPPHIHNVSYRGVVVSGLIHNDDPEAAFMWMPAGSFWTQPKGEAHITAARGSNNVAYIEIDEGPYLVRPADQAFDSGERPVNVDPSNIVWLDASDTTRLDASGTAADSNRARIAFLWGNPRDDRPSGALVKLPSRFNAEIFSHGSTFRAVVIQGQLQYRPAEKGDSRTLPPGSYFGSKGESVHHVSTGPGGESILYVRAAGRFEVTGIGHKGP